MGKSAVVIDSNTWRKPYQQFMDIVEKHAFKKDYEATINAEIQTLYDQHKGDPIWDEAWRRWSEC